MVKKFRLERIRFFTNILGENKGGGIVEENDNIAQQIRKLEETIRKNRIKDNIIIILFIIVIFFLCILGYRIQKIGYYFVETSGIGEIDDIIKITEDGLELGENAQLNIFNNSEYNNEKIIAPHSKGTYQFCIKNEIDSNITHNIKFFDEMSNFVNMKFKLKLNNVYICGNENEYVSIDELKYNNIILVDNSTSVYTLEWYWDDNDLMDTYIGSSPEKEYYTLGLNIQASKLEN